MYYLSRSRSSLACPRDYRENPGFAWPTLPPLGRYRAREIARLRENGRVIRYDEHRENTVTAALTATLPGVKDGDRAVITLDFFPAELTLAVSSNGMALPRTYGCRLHLANAVNVFGEVLTDARVNISFTPRRGAARRGR